MSVHEFLISFKKLFRYIATQISFFIVFIEFYQSFLVGSFDTKNWSKYESLLGFLQNLFIIFFSTIRGFTRFFSQTCSGDILQCILWVEGASEKKKNEIHSLNSTYNIKLSEP